MRSQAAWGEAVWEAGVHIPHRECLEDRWVLGRVDAFPRSFGGLLGLPVDEVRNSDLQDALLPSAFSGNFPWMPLQGWRMDMHTHGRSPGLQSRCSAP